MQHVEIYQVHGSKTAQEAINRYLTANPDFEIQPGHITPISMTFSGGEQGTGIVVVYSKRQA